MSSPLELQIPQTTRGIGNIKVVKATSNTLSSEKHKNFLKNLDYLETQIGRLAKMARDVRADYLHMTIE